MRANPRGDVTELFTSVLATVAMRARSACAGSLLMLFSAEHACAQGEHASVRAGLEAYRAGDPAEARNRFESGCDEELMVACTYLGELLRGEEGGPADPIRARELLKQACERANIGACLSLANLRYTGEGGPRDVAGARLAYRTTCEAGLTSGCYLYAVLLRDDGDGARDLGHARRLFGILCDFAGDQVDDAASAALHANACNAGGTLLWNGRGGPKDAEGALTAYRRACQLGHEKSCQVVPEIERVLAIGERLAEIDSRQRDLDRWKGLLEEKQLVEEKKQLIEDKKSEEEGLLSQAEREKATLEDELRTAAREAEEIRDRVDSIRSGFGLPAIDRGALAPLPARPPDYSDADIIGLTIGMNSAEAERIIREEMQVGWTETQDSRQWRAGAPEPLDDYRVFISEDGLHRVTLFWHPGDRSRVIGIARAIAMPAPADAAGVRGSLIEKYGSPDFEWEHGVEDVMVWTAHPGVHRDAWDDPDAPEAENFYSSTCSVEVYWRKPRTLVAEREELDDNIRTHRLLPIGPYMQFGGRPEDDFARSGFHDRCGPVIYAQMRDFADHTILTYGIADSEAYRRAEPTIERPVAELPEL